MATFCVEYHYTDDSAGRDTHRAEHRSYLGDQPGVLISGPYADQPDGALIILRADSREEVEQILDADPFQRAGLIADRTIREYKPVLGALAAQFAES